MAKPSKKCPDVEQSQSWREELMALLMKLNGVYGVASSIQDGNVVLIDVDVDKGVIEEVRVRAENWLKDRGIKPDSYKLRIESLLDECT